MIRKIWSWIQLWGLMYYAYESKLVLNTMVATLVFTAIIGGFMVLKPELFTKNHA